MNNDFEHELSVFDTDRRTTQRLSSKLRVLKFYALLRQSCD